MRTHNLKLNEEFWDVVMAGQKTFELRNNDRGFQKGDRIIFNKTDRLGVRGVESEAFIITYVLAGWGMSDGYVALSIKPEQVEP